MSETEIQRTKRRLTQWNTSKGQKLKYSMILRAFLELEKTPKKITLQDLIKYCTAKYPPIHDFSHSSTYCDMLNTRPIESAPHIFQEDTDGYLSLWEDVAYFIKDTWKQSKENTPNIWRIVCKPKYDPHRKTFDVLINNNVVGIGWGVPDSDIKTPEEYEEKARYFYRNTKKNPPNPAINFAKKVKKGDLIWSRSKKGEYYLGIIIGEWKYSNTEYHGGEIDLPHFRPCKWFKIKNHPKDLFKEFSGLTFCQIHKKSIIEKTIEIYHSKVSEEELNHDSAYVSEVNNIDDDKIEADKHKNAHKNLKTPQQVSTAQEKYPRDPEIGALAKKESNYTCSMNKKHKTFTAKSNKKNYVEAHHFIPMAEYEYFAEEYKKNIDCIENIVPLCPNCHRQIHHATNTEKAEIIETLFNKCSKKDDLASIGINITLDELLSAYDIHK